MHGIKKRLNDSSVSLNQAIFTERSALQTMREGSRERPNEFINV